MSKSENDTSRQPPVATPQEVAQLASEGAQLRREVRRRIAAMWNISSDKRHARSR